MRLFLAISLSLLSSALALKGDNGCGTYMCVNATVVGDVVTYEMTPLFRRPPGWMAVGFGKRMKDTHMVIMWKNEDGSMSLSQRYATGHTEPQVVDSPPRLAHVGRVKSAQWHAPELTTYAFDIPVNQTLLAGNGGNSSFEELIWAYGLLRPKSPARRAFLPQHFAAGRLRLDFAKDVRPELLANPSLAGVPTQEASKVTPPPTSEMAPPPAKTLTGHERLIVLHGIGISFGMIILLPLAALSARFLRTISAKWIKIHEICNFYIGLPLIIISWLLAPIAIFNADAEHFSDPHKICGLALLFLYIAQVSFGRFIHGRPKKISHPPVNILHVGFGCLLITLAFLQVQSGLDEWEKATGRPHPEILHIVVDYWATGVLFLYLAGLCLLRRQFWQEKNGAWPKSEYIALPGSSGDRSPINATPNHRVIFSIGEENGSFIEAKDPDAVPLLHKP